MNATHGHATTIKGHKNLKTKKNEIEKFQNTYFRELSHFRIFSEEKF